MFGLYAFVLINGCAGETEQRTANPVVLDPQYIQCTAQCRAIYLVCKQGCLDALPAGNGEDECLYECTLTYARCDEECLGLYPSTYTDEITD